MDKVTGNTPEPEPPSTPPETENGYNVILFERAGYPIGRKQSNRGIRKTQVPADNGRNLRFKLTAKYLSVCDSHKKKCVPHGVANIAHTCTQHKLRTASARRKSTVAVLLYGVLTTATCERHAFWFRELSAALHPNNILAAPVLSKGL